MVRLQIVIVNWRSIWRRRSGSFQIGIGDLSTMSKACLVGQKSVDSFQRSLPKPDVVLKSKAHHRYIRKWFITFSISYDSLLGSAGEMTTRPLPLQMQLARRTQYTFRLSYSCVISFIIVNVDETIVFQESSSRIHYWPRMIGMIWHWSWVGGASPKSRKKSTVRNLDTCITS